MEKILISAEGVSMEAELNDSDTAREIFNALPLEGDANLWGDEIYFDIPVSLGSEPGARADVEVGELGYWPVGSAFCVFYGPTPVSTGDKPRAYSPVNVFGRVIGDATVFKAVSQGARVRVTQL